MTPAALVPRRPADPRLGRLERTALGLTAAGAATAWLIPGGGAGAAAAVIGGALLAGTSYWAIKRGVTGLLEATSGGGSARGAAMRGLAGLVLRYALLAGMAYVMIARLRLAPIALFCGASIFVAATVVEFLREMGRRTRG